MSPLGPVILRRLPWLAVLTVVWILLNGDATVANLLGGVLVAAGVLLVFPLADEPRRHRTHPLGVVRFVVYVLANLVTSSLQVVVTVLFPTPERLRAGIVRVELPGASPLVTTLVANAITLTPGTLTVTAESDPGVLHVHVLGLGDLEEFRAEIRDLQARALRAFTPVDGSAP